MRRKTIQKHFEKTVEALNECDIKATPRPRIGRVLVGGWYLDGRIAIRNRPDKENLVLNLIHEAWHHIKPEWTEKKIEAWSCKLFCEFSTNEHAALLQFLKRRK